ncbi:hypothetical protein [Antarcticirhabdus aurantiaca]|uniref:Uncharacterized protein n=1 Tax=Antarcticirhabdus aurantiaca TaxID=2606717 RepID=A0ACD4NP26_9HYPH|nr:hypothetical protein [Antarcticirhabdus aurantiaca]WAJ28385.1 hypothetical protein OXU80_26845 [Jeongeuplla avenae]
MLDVTFCIPHAKMLREAISPHPLAISLEDLQALTLEHLQEGNRSARLPASRDTPKSDSTKVASDPAGMTVPGGSADWRIVLSGRLQGYHAPRWSRDRDEEPGDPERRGAIGARPRSVGPVADGYPDMARTLP